MRIPLFAITLALMACDSPSVHPDDDPAQPSYEVRSDWPQLPSDLRFGRPLGVAVDSLGRVYVSHTADKGAGNASPIAAPTIFIFDPDTGAFLGSLGAGLFRYPHGISIDRDDFIWVTDSEANRVFKLNRQGQVLLTLGKD